MSKITTNENYTDLPSDYTSWVAKNSACESSNGYMVYSAPIPISEIMDPELINENIIIVADDMAGYMIGYLKKNTGWEFVGIDSCTLDIDPISEGFVEYIEI
ncbi:hypothetical protein I6F65_19615 [Pseudoalteromonas sp. SWXJZ94C]|uniref:hypothetical protein n=1 Tax=Pseudoalteromonas sp. SWXJZ94C TaxID=2792065 RepID=UPI0018CF3307|nr:hypothetical protein [Pseudoalteromonas sp. SWXJZ94C]MBH0059153.1 hypothetical protein [Pseudoalteromonas sp. SWXJZ94C]